MDVRFKSGTALPAATFPYHPSKGLAYVSPCSGNCGVALHFICFNVSINSFGHYVNLEIIVSAFRIPSSRHPPTTYSPIATRFSQFLQKPSFKSETRESGISHRLVSAPAPSYSELRYTSFHLDFRYSQEISPAKMAFGVDEDVRGLDSTAPVSLAPGNFLSTV